MQAVGAGSGGAVENTTNQTTVNNAWSTGGQAPQSSSSDAHDPAAANTGTRSTHEVLVPEIIPPKSGSSRGGRSRSSATPPPIIDAEFKTVGGGGGGGGDASGTSDAAAAGGSRGPGPGPARGPADFKNDAQKREELRKFKIKAAQDKIASGKKKLRDGLDRLAKDQASGTVRINMKLPD